MATVIVLFVSILELCHGQGIGYIAGRSGEMYSGGRDPYYMSGGVRAPGGSSFMTGGTTYMGGRGSTFGGSFTGPSYTTGGTPSFMGRGGGSRSVPSRGSRTGYRDGQIREGYIGARGGQNHFPIHGGYCAGEYCADGGAAAGVGMGYGMGSMSAMDDRIRRRTNEDIRMYEMFAGGPSSTAGGMGSGMMARSAMPFSGPGLMVG